MKNLDKLLNHVSGSDNAIILPEKYKLVIIANSIKIEYIDYFDMKTLYNYAHYYGLPKYIIGLLQSRNLIKIQLALNLI